MLLTCANDRVVVVGEVFDSCIADSMSTADEEFALNDNASSSAVNDKRE